MVVRSRNFGAILLQKAKKVRDNVPLSSSFERKARARPDHPHPREIGKPLEPRNIGYDVSVRAPTRP